MQDMAEIDEAAAEIVEQAAPEPEEAEAAEPETEEPGEEPEAEELVVTIGDAPPPDDDERDAKPWVTELRKKYREAQRENRELQSRLAQVSQVEKPAELPKKPTIADFDYDTAKYEAALLQWSDAKRAHDWRQEQQRQAQEQAQKDWQEKLAGYGRQAAALRVKDFAEVEDEVKGVFNVAQQGVIVHGAENPALLVYALGRDPKRLAEIAAIKDPVKFAFAVAKLEGQIKMAPAPKKPAPERTVKGNGPLSGAVGANLETLRKQAEDTGDWTAYFAAKRKSAPKG